MRVLLGLSRRIDTLNSWLGRSMAWLVLVAVLVSAVNAILRKAFDMSSNAWLELQWVLFGMVFLLCAPWTLIANEHIRIDIVNNLLTRRTRSIIDLVGHVLFLLPVTVVMVWTSWPFFYDSYRMNEGSLNAGGLPQWPAKFLIPLAFAILFVQGLSELIKRIAVMTGHLEDTTSGGRHHASAEAEAKRLLAEIETQRQTNKP